MGAPGWLSWLSIQLLVLAALSLPHSHLWLVTVVLDSIGFRGTAFLCSPMSGV